MTNQQLAHELLLDPLFQLDESGGCSTENPAFHGVRESFHRAFWDSIEDDVKLEPPCYVRVIRVLEDICDGIHHLREDSGIHEAVDLAFVKQQVEAGLYTWAHTQKLLASIVSIIEHIEMPEHDGETKTMWEALQAVGNEGEVRPSRALCNQLEFLLNRVNVLRIDAANVRLRNIASVIMEHGVDYEREKFEEKLKEGTLTLERTTAWISRAITKPEDIVGGSRLAYLTVHTEAVRSLITSPYRLTSDTCPETLLLDMGHLNVLRAKFHTQAMAATLMMMVSTIIPPSEFATHKERLVEILFSVENGLSKNAQILEDTIQNIKGLLSLSDLRVEHLRESTQPTLRVHTIIDKRLVECWTVDTLPPASTSALGKLFGFIYPSIVQSVRKFKRIVEVSRNVHLPIYNRIIAEEARKKTLAR